VPGKTITVNFFKGDGVYFVDLPGYGYAKREQSEKKRWAELMEGYFQSDRNIRLVIQLIDMRHAPSADDMTMLNFLRESGIPFIIALTKCDKLNKTETEKRRAELLVELSDYPEIKTIEFSSVKGTVKVCENGSGVDFSEEIAKGILLEKEITVVVDLNDGEQSSKAWGCDLTYDYVKINGDYRT
jgi:ribosome biogenesis GTP-binding protein YsxC/EngB